MQCIGKDHNRRHLPLWVVESAEGLLGEHPLISLIWAPTEEVVEEAPLVGRRLAAGEVQLVQEGALVISRRRP